MIKGARQILQPAQFQQFGTMEEAKDELMAMERVLLQTIKFDFNIEHAHKFIIQVHLVRRALPIFVMALRSYLGFSIVKIYVMNYWNHLTKKK